MVTACAVGPRSPSALPTGIPAPQLQGRLVHLQSRNHIDFNQLLQALAKAQVIALGEEHYHPAIQAFELKLLKALPQQKSAHLALAMELLERDAQTAVDAYLAGEIDLDTFHTRIKASKAFERLYAPLVQHAQQVGIPIIAMNLPRRIARQVSKEGLEIALNNLSPTDRAYVPVPLPDIPERYRHFFLERVSAHHPVEGDAAERFTAASFIKDVTMSTALATFLDAHPQHTILAIAGRFHVDYGIAIPALLQQHHPDLRIVRLTTMTVADDSHVDLERLQSEAIADYVYFFAPGPRDHTASATAASLQTK